MDLTIYLVPIIKWWKLIVIAALIAGVSTLFAIRGQPPVYDVHTTLMLGQSINNPNPSSVQFYLEQELAKIYADMGSREPIRKATMEALGLNWLPVYFIRALPNSQLIEIRVRDTEPVRAQVVAAELANQLIHRTPTDIDPEDQARGIFVDEQLNILQEDIQTTQEELAALEIHFGDLSSAREIADVDRQIMTLEEKLRTLQSTYATLVSSTQRGAVNTLTIVEPAEVPTRSTGTNRILSVGLAAALGVSVATGGAYLIEFLDRRVSSPKEVRRLLKWPVLAEIEKMPEERDPSTYVYDHPHSVIADSFRTLKTNLELAGLANRINTLLVTGPSVSQGKSTIAFNLALTLAAGDKKVVLMDGDFHRPQHKYTGMKGLSDSLLDGGDPECSPLFPYPGQLYLLPAGLVPSEAIGLLDTSNLNRIFCALKEVADILIIDGPPAFVSDALVFAASADGVLTVVRIGHSPLDTITQMKAQFKSANVKPLGIVINDISRRPIYYSSYYGFDSAADRQAARPPVWKKIWERIKGSRSAQWDRKLDDDGTSERPI